MEKVHVMAEAWDYLIVLDACRFDAMKSIWKRHLDGKLTKRISAGSSTLEWRNANFSDHYEGVVYVSSNPYINGTIPVKGFLGSDHFDRVYDVWRTDWDRDRGTVLPKAVSDAAVVAMGKHPGARLIVHYLQPHAPYLGLDDSMGFPSPDPTYGKVLTGTNTCGEPGTKVFLLKALTAICYKARLLGTNPTWRLRQMLRMAPASPMDAVRRKYGDSGLRAAYEANLRVVLQEIADLIRYMSGRVIVTSDHGELLGEGGRYSHFVGSTLPELLEIPWLVIEKKGREPLDTWVADRREVAEVAGEDGEQEIKERLRALGYIE